jgi:hypothetical protein
VTGVGIGATVVPITSAALSAVPPERSGMAASVANTSREVGAVLGVAVLGALVNSQLHTDLTSRLRQLGIPANFQAIVIDAIETGTVPPNSRATGAGGAAGQGQEQVVQDVIHAAYDAFHTGLQAALFLSAALVLAAGLFTLIVLRNPGSRPGSSRQTAMSSPFTGCGEIKCRRWRLPSGRRAPCR